MKYLTMILVTLSIGFTTGCGRKGPIEKAGESMDKVGEKVKDAVTPDGPLEKAGKKLDRAVDKVVR